MQSACRGSYPAAGASLSKKASQSFASADAKAVLYVFCRDMCVAENTLRGVSVELSAISGQQRRRTQRSFLEKAAKPLFRQSNACRGSYPAAGAFSCLCARHTPPRGAPNRPYKYLPVILYSLLCISSGVPHATILPPASPPPGPMSMT